MEPNKTLNSRRIIVYLDEETYLKIVDLKVGIEQDYGKIKMNWLVRRLISAGLESINGEKEKITQD
jgi:hypothetical protein